MNLSKSKYAGKDHTKRDDKLYNRVRNALRCPNCLNGVSYKLIEIRPFFYECELCGCEWDSHTTSIRNPGKPMIAK